MKKTSDAHKPEDELKLEYDFNYQKARNNRFAGQFDSTRTVVVLDPSLSTVFPTPESVNKVLRALVKTMPARPSAAKKQRKVQAKV